MWKGHRAPWLTPPSCRNLLHAAPDWERMMSSYALCQRLSMSSGSNGLRQRNHLTAGWTSGFYRGAIRLSANACPSSSPKCTTSSQNSYSSGVRPSNSATLTSIDGAEERGYEHLPPLDESVAAHLCPPMAIGWKARATHPSKPCKATSALAGRAYSAAGQAASALNSMAVLQVFQAKMLATLYIHIPIYIG